MVLRQESPPEFPPAARADADPGEEADPPHPGHSSSSSLILRHNEIPEAEPFFWACGGSRAVELVVQSARGSSTRHVWDRPFALIGRAPDCDLQLDHPDVGLRHAYLQLIGGRVLCVDLASRTGTHWADGPRVAGWLEAGEPVRIGPYSVRLASGGAPVTDASANGGPADASGADAAELGPAREPRLRFPGPAGTSRMWPVRRAVTLMGRHRRCKVRLSHPSVSPVHCSLVRSRGELWVVDLAGGNGIAVDGRAVPFQRLEDGSELHVGKFRIGVSFAATDQERDAPSAGASVQSSWTLVPAALQEASAGSSLAPRSPAPAPASSGLSEAFVSNLIGEFAAMQQRTLDHAQESIMALGRMMGEMHQNQLEAFRQESERFELLSDEVREMRSELTRLREHAQRQAAQAGPLQMSPASAPTTPPPSRPPAPTGPPPMPASASPPPPAGSPPSGSTAGASPTTESPDSASQPESTPQREPASAPPAASPSPPAESDGASPPLDESDIAEREAWLRERLAAVEGMIEESRSTWSGKLSRLLGK